MDLVNTKDTYKKIFFLITFIIFQILAIFAQVYYTFYLGFLIITIFFLNVYPLYKLAISYNTNEEIPLFEFTHIFFFLTYTIGILFIDYSFYFFEYYSINRHYFPGNLSHKLITNTLEIYLIGLLFFNLGNYLVRKYLKKK